MKLSEQKQKCKTTPKHPQDAAASQWRHFPVIIPCKKHGYNQRSVCSQSNPPVQQHHKRGGERKLQWSANWAVVEPCINRLKSQEFLSRNGDANTSFLLLVWTELCSRGKFLLSNFFFFSFSFSIHSRSWISKFLENRFSVKIFHAYSKMAILQKILCRILLLIQRIWKWQSFDIWWNLFWVPSYYRTPEAKSHQYHEVWYQISNYQNMDN